MEDIKLEKFLRTLRDHMRAKLPPKAKVRPLLICHEYKAIWVIHTHGKVLVMKKIFYHMTPISIGVWRHECNISASYIVCHFNSSGNFSSNWA